MGIKLNSSLQMAAKRDSFYCNSFQSCKPDELMQKYVIDFSTKKLVALVGVHSPLANCQPNKASGAREHISKNSLVRSKPFKYTVIK